MPHYPIADDVLEKVIRLKLDRMARRVATNHTAEFKYDDKLVEAVLASCTKVDTGARNIDHILNGCCCPKWPSRCWAA